MAGRSAVDKVLSLRGGPELVAFWAQRIASWLPLSALYAMRRTRALVIGEFLSMPLFAVLLAAHPRLTLESAGALWLASYLAYALFNLWAVRRAY